MIHGRVKGLNLAELISCLTLSVVCKVKDVLKISRLIFFVGNAFTSGAADNWGEKR